MKWCFEGSALNFNGIYLLKALTCMIFSCMNKKGTRLKKKYLQFLLMDFSRSK